VLARSDLQRRRLIRSALGDRHGNNLLERQEKQNRRAARRGRACTVQSDVAEESFALSLKEFLQAVKEFLQGVGTDLLPQ
jgi:hypothetical protein